MLAGRTTAGPSPHTSSAGTLALPAGTEGAGLAEGDTAGLAGADAAGLGEADAAGLAGADGALAGADAAALAGADTARPHAATAKIVNP
jgi:hypothetical protein